MVLKRKTARPGDIFQILTSEGVCYGLVTHLTGKSDGVIAIFREFYDQPPEDFQALVEQKPQFITAFAIRRAVRQRMFALVAEVTIPKHLAEFPLFKDTHKLRGDDTIWFFWDGKNEWQVKRPLTAKEKLYPIGPRFINFPGLIENIEKNCRQDSDFL